MTGPKMEAPHVFHDPVFWMNFRKKVESMSWKCNLGSDVLLESLETDASLYKDDSTFRKRRLGVLPWVTNETEWVSVVLGACTELANNEPGYNSQKLRDVHILEALVDFVEHINYFYAVASRMADKGLAVTALSQDSSNIHDVDKLDPVMLVGYSERFEDNVETSLWNLCVDRHTVVNPHHQGHCMWKDCYVACPFHELLRSKALREMVCDKVSRRLQKNLNGNMSRAMWDVDMVYFKGLPQGWLDRASLILRDMK